MIKQALKKWSVDFAAYLKSAVPVKSGKLQRSITPKTINDNESAIEALGYINEIKEKPELDKKFKESAAIAANSKETEQSVIEITDKIVQSMAEKIAKDMGITKIQKR